eukprot:CAMPEP_0201521302 /NCGR_PEP_ID=MMETSP0161_2-20130828/14341_1 /ASSEMBLY_ACC=CAM_ASM_000251 /TAXON_ID=180227 /ORGANISM="Neoparamoeba aestuarina, Strain SoJaBio B1-5/56/2" /LENGTH=190 /DNA_ID=CAMNT_0047919917 /DNA_START=81 /DNA_END=653 /DNA_ORIENTATION=-
MGMSQPSRARRGIWLGKKILTGNNVSFSEKKTRRRWLPNVHTHKYYSFILNREMDIEVTSKAMRTIDKYGGIDPFIMYSKKKLLEDSDVALGLRKEMEEEYKSVTGRNWNASVARFHDRKKKFEDWEEQNCKIPEEERKPFKRSHYIMYDIAPLDIHGYYDKVVLETGVEEGVTTEMMINQTQDVEMLDG